MGSGDTLLLRRGIGSDPCIGTHFLYAGTGYGGACFPKDVKVLVRTGHDLGADLWVLTAVEAANDTQKRVLVDKQGRCPLQRPSAGTPIRPLGPGFQAGHRRHARSAESGDRARAAAPRCGDPGLRPGGDGRNLFDPALVRSLGLEYCAIGRGAATRGVGLEG